MQPISYTKAVNQANKLALEKARQSVLAEFRRLDQLVLKSMHSAVPLVEQVGHYIIDSGGKRMRPLLLLLAAGNLAYAGNDHIQLAVIVEFIHTATLLHDDVVDASILRRGRETANYKWDNSTSILVGDFIYSRAFQLLTELKRMDYMDVLATTTNVIAEGEVLQLQEQHNPEASEAVYMEIIRRKTAVLFSAAMELAALAANRQDLKLAMKDYGLNLGIAFQLIDDLLDYTQDDSVTGKQLGDDLSEGKATLPLIYALTCVSEAEKTLIRQAIIQGNSQEINQILSILKNTDVFTRIRQLAETYIEKALAALEKLPDNLFRQHLRDLALFTLARDH